MTDNNSIEVIEIRRAATGNLKAFVSIRLPNGWQCHDWRIIQKEGEKVWVSPPVAAWRGPDKKMNYKQIVTIPAVELQKIQLQILLAWEKENQDGPTT